MSTPQTSGVLSHLQRRLALLWGGRLLLMLAAVVALLALAVLAVDAVAVLPLWARVRSPWLLGAGAAAVLLLGLATVRRLRARQVARRLEANDPALGSQLTNAVQLAGRPADSPIAEALRRRAVALGRDRAGATRAWPVARKAVLAAAVGALLVGALWGVGGLAFPDALRAVLPRFLDPHGDHPPYSRVRITAAPGNTEVLYGGQCEIRARTDGPPVEKLTLVTTRNGQPAETVMFVAPDRSFFQTVVNIREATEYYVTDGRARTHRHRIGVKLTPRITRLEVKTEFPAYTGKPPTVDQLKDDALAEPVDKRLPRGSRLSFRVRSNRPLASG
ncbi:hypothetical protein HQ560_10250, partial [bacterium]|nr:hypothetical protein [bacterium]